MTSRVATDARPRITQLLRAGGIFHDVDGSDKAAVLRECVRHVPTADREARRVLLEALEARESRGSTGIGDGIAIPHAPRDSDFGAEQSFLTLCLLRRPVEFGAIDGRPVHAVFIPFVIDPALHLHVMAKLGALFRDDVLRGLLLERAPAERILGRIEMLERPSAG